MKKPDGLKKYSIKILVAARNMAEAEYAEEEAVALASMQTAGVLHSQVESTGERFTEEELSFLGFDADEEE